MFSGIFNRITKKDDARSPNATKNSSFSKDFSLSKLDATTTTINIDTEHGFRYSHFILMIITISFWILLILTYFIIITIMLVSGNCSCCNNSTDATGRKLEALWLQYSIANKSNTDLLMVSA